MVTQQEGAHSSENNKEKVSITDLQSKLLDLEAKLEEYRERADQDKEVNRRVARDPW